jgi:hypothetical protein
MKSDPSKCTVFLCYSRNDAAKYKDEIMQYLRIPKEYKIDPFVDSVIGPGEDWEDRIKLALESAKVFIFLVSPGSLTSDFIQMKEFPEALRKHGKIEHFKIFPLLVRQIPDSSPHDVKCLNWINREPLVGMDDSARDNIYSTLTDQIVEFLRHGNIDTDNPVIPCDREKPNAPSKPLPSTRTQSIGDPELPGIPEDLAGQPKRGPNGRAQVLKVFTVRNRSGRRVRFWYWHHDRGKDEQRKVIANGWNRAELEFAGEQRESCVTNAFCAGYTFLVVEDLSGGEFRQCREGWWLFSPGSSVVVDIPDDYFVRVESDEAPPRLEKKETN